MAQLNNNWSDYLYFLKISEYRNLQQAAEVLGVNSSTVYRRLNALEERLDNVFFERSRAHSGYNLTFAGEQMLERLKGVEDLFIDIESHFNSGVLDIAGRIKIATTDNIGDTWLLPYIIAFKDIHPKITIDLTFIDHNQATSYNKADLLFTLTNKPSEYMEGRKLQDIHLQLYANEELVRVVKQSEIPQGQLWEKVGVIMPSGQLKQLNVTRWLLSWVDAKAIRVEANEFIGLYQYCLQKVGITVLPEYMASGSDQLKKVMNIPKELSTSLWMLSHMQNTRTACCRLFQDFLIEELSKDS